MRILYKCGEQLQREIINTELPERSAALWALGQAGFIIKIGNQTLVVDPYLSNSIYETVGEPWVRNFAPLLLPDELPDLDLVLCTHHHEDHMDIATLRPLRHRKDTRFLMPKAHEPIMTSWGFSAEQLIGVNHMDSIVVNGIEIKSFAAMHDRFEQDSLGNHLFLGYIIKFGGITIYHAGDTLGFPDLAEWLKKEQVDIALIPINGRDFVRTSQGIVGNCNYREAVELAAAGHVDLVIPMHFGLFPHNDENPAYFVDYLYANYPQQKFHMMTAGERFVFVK